MKRRLEITSKLDKFDSGYRSAEFLEFDDDTSLSLEEAPSRKKSKIAICVDGDNKENKDTFIRSDNDRDGFMITVTTCEVLEDWTKVIEGTTIDTEKMYQIRLEEDWKNTSITPGQQVFILRPLKVGDTTFVISNTKGLVIVEPTLLIAPTTVASFHKCERKAVLRERCAEGSEPSLPLLIGNSIHELFQWAVRNSAKKEITNVKFLEAIFRSRIIKKFVKELALLNMDVRTFVSHVQEYIQTIGRWIVTYMPKPNGNGEILIEENGLRIESIVDIEENVWLPNIGLKGKIDVTLKLRDSQGNVKYSALELKTGKTVDNIEHVTQASLYSLMLSVLDSQDVVPLQLLYLKDGTKRIVKPNDYAIGAMIRMRNEISRYIKIVEDPVTPGIQSEPSICSYCSMSTFCSLERISEKRKGISSRYDGTIKFLKSKVDHLSNEDVEYFIKWRDMLFLEWSSISKENGPSSLYELTVEERSQRGTCLANLLLTDIEDKDNLRLTFSISSLPGDFRKKWIVGEFVYISSSDRTSICNGTIVENDTKLVVEALTPISRYLTTNKHYHLDTIEYMRHFQMNIMSIVRLMECNDSSNCLRSIIVKDHYPTSQRISPSQLKVILPFINNLSEPQRDAVIHSIKNTGYSLIKGMPGAGKTTVIAALVRSLVALGKSVLIACYTNSAVDNCLEKLNGHIRDDLILRIGTDSRAQEWSKKYCLKEKIKDIQVNDEKIAAVRKIYSSSKVVAGTCISIQEHQIFKVHEKFDVCIVDEASLCLECTVIMSLLNCKSFVLVGDEKQLTPLVKNKEAGERGMNVSLFERLSMTKKGLHVINTQFRMNKVLCRVPSELFYEGEMRCATTHIENAVIKCNDWNPHIDGGNFDLSEEICEKVLSKRLEDSLIFIDMNNYICGEKVDTSLLNDNRSSNLAEATTAIGCLKLLLHFGVSSTEIGVITPFRNQMNTIRGLINELICLDKNDDRLNNVEVSTIDQFQGRDKKVIIFSTVYNYTEDNETCDLLNSSRRMNVALTRAKHKLVIIGCAGSLRKLEIPSKVIGLINNIIPLK